MRVLIGCERSGVLRDAFRARGHEAFSCDLAPSLTPSAYHIQADIADVAFCGHFDLMIAHPPCRYVSYMGARWWRRPGWRDEQQKALLLFELLLNAPIERVALENPRGLPMRLIRPPDDVYDPYNFGEPYAKRTYLWLRNLPPLWKSFTCSTWESGWTKRVHGFARSVTSAGVARAMAEQWG